MHVTVVECQEVQTSWYRVRAETLGGEVWTDGPLTWISGPDGMNLMFPPHVPRAALRRGVDRARDLGYDSVGVWLCTQVDTAALSGAGFERGWSPWWMTAPLAAITAPDDPRVELQFDTTDYDGEHVDYRDQLALTRTMPGTAWYAAAYADPPSTQPASRRFAGRAWSFRDPGRGAVAGIFDMAVWPPFRRRGLGNSLLRTVCAAAAAAGAERAVLNATPEGKLLYSRHGFTQIGEGITWWLHPAAR